MPKKDGKCPGVMLLYFEIRDILRRLDLNDIGRLL